MLFLATNSDGDVGALLLISIALLCFICLLIYFLPSIVAFQRDHHYKWVIFGVNLFFGATGVAYLAVLIWSFWPKNTGLIDVVKNDLTSNSFDANRIIYSKQGANNHAQQQSAVGLLVYVLKNRIQNGPYPSSALALYLRNGNFSYQDLCWYQGAPTWVPISQVASIIGIPPHV